ncbi:Mu transposase C-terminal domain-containing protein [uncultured Methylobacterium sp.]|uniref:Mu transposase C-terminal domain-containing protein n=1 Tax=uncultured Methylobacterium sp. TaxID=157278 RepID=UPI0035CB2544
MAATATATAAQFGGIVKIARRQRILVGKVVHSVRQRVDNTRFSIEVVETGEASTKTYAWLDEGWLSGEITILPTRWDELDAGTQTLLQTEMDAATPEMRRIAYYRQPYAEALADWQEGKADLTKTLHQLFQDIANRRNASCAPQDYERPPKRTQLYDWTARWRKADRDIRALLPNHPGRGNRTARVCGTLADILDELIEAVFLTPIARTKVAMYAAATRNITTLNDEAGRPGAELMTRIPLPTRTMVERRCDKLELYDKAYYRKDPLKAAQEHLPVGLGPVAHRVNERWELDSSPLDILVIDAGTGALLGRPVITAVIDCATRLIIGWRISFEGESTLQIMLTLRHAIAPKLPIAGVKNPNPGRGKPSGIWVDNGKAHRSNAMTEAGRQLGFEVFWLPPKRPRLRGKIERWLRTLGVSLIHNLQGTTKSNPKAREHYDAEKDAVFTLEEITWLISYWINDVYNQREHRATRRSLVGLWRELAEELAPSLLSNVADLDILLTKVEDRKVTRKGIEWNGLLYNSPLLALLRNRPDFDPEQIQIRADENDISHLRVLGPGMPRYQSVPCTNKAYAKGKNLHRHLCAIKHAKVRAAEDRQLTEGDFELAWGELILAGKTLMEGNGRRKTLKRLGRLFALGIDPAAARPPASFRMEGVFDDEDDDGEVDAKPEAILEAPGATKVAALSDPVTTPDPDPAPEPGLGQAPRQAKPRVAPRKQPKPANERTPSEPVPAPATPVSAPLDMEADYD